MTPLQYIGPGLSFLGARRAPGGEGTGVLATVLLHTPVVGFGIVLALGVLLGLAVSHRRPWLTRLGISWTFGSTAMVWLEVVRLLLRGRLF